VHIKSKKGKAIQFANFEIIEKITANETLSKNYFYLAIRTIILICLILAASGMVYEYFGTTSAFNFVLAIDNSISMDAKDLQPSRLEAAKQAAIDFIDSLPSKTKVGLVSFAGNSIIKNKLVDDKDEIKQSISELEISGVGGTDLGSALTTSTNLLLTEPRSRVIVLLTDGRSNIGMPIEEALDIVNENKVIVYTIGIGTEKGAEIPGLEITSTLDEATLANIAKSTGGEFFLVTDEILLKNAYSKIAGITKDKVAWELTNPLLILVALFLAISWVLEYLKFGTIP